MKVWELVEWPVWPYGAIAHGTPIYSVFDREKDRHVHWNKDRQNCIEWAERVYGAPTRLTR